VSIPEIRLCGDPFPRSGAAAALRALLDAANRAGWRCGIGLGECGGDPGGARRVELHGGGGAREVRTDLSAAELAPVLAALAWPVAATAPLVVFGGDDAVRRAALAHGEACFVLSGAGLAPERALALVAAHLRGWPHADPELVAPDAEALARLPDPRWPGRVLHVGADAECGTDLAVTAAARGALPLTVLLPERDAAREAELRALAESAAPAGAVDLVFAAGDPSAAHLSAAAAVLLPWRVAQPPRVLLDALASGRPVLVSRWAATARALRAPEICLPLGGRRRGAAFEPDLRAIDAALRALRDDYPRALERGRRAQRVALEHWRPARPVPPPAPARGERTTIVLEAPLLETSSTSVLTLATARALVQRGRADVYLVPRPPFEHSLAWLRSRAPELVSHLCAVPPPADLWLSAGWPPRPDRPATRCFAVRFDWEYGALPLELTPLLTEEADLVVVHSRAVARTLAAAGRPARGVVTIPHGVAPAFAPEATPDPRILASKGARPALLFVGGLIWRKGIDVLLSAALRDLRGPGAPVLVIKPVGSASSYAGYHLGDLVERVRRTLGESEVLVLDGDASDAEMAGIYTACDLLVHPYRGEGFGMSVLEARASGLPVVVTRGGSTDDFCDGASCLGVAAVRRRIALPGAHVGHPWVLEPDAADLGSTVREALRDLPLLRAAALREAAAVRARHDWAHAAERLLRIASDVRSRPERGPVPGSLALARAT
jgi:glycosyltransferase involved in cell wall biosynthesis